MDLLPLFFGPAGSSAAVRFWNGTTAFDARASALYDVTRGASEDRSFARFLLIDAELSTPPDLKEVGDVETVFANPFFMDQENGDAENADEASDNDDEADVRIPPHLVTEDGTCLYDLSARTRRNAALPAISQFTCAIDPERSIFVPPTAVLGISSDTSGVGGTFTSGTLFGTSAWAEAPMDAARALLERSDDFGGYVPVIDALNPFWAGVGSSMVASLADELGCGRSLFVTAIMPAMPPVLAAPLSSRAFPLTSRRLAAQDRPTALTTALDAPVLDIGLFIAATAAPECTSWHAAGCAVPTDGVAFLDPAAWPGAWRADMATVRAGAEDDDATDAQRAGDASAYLAQHGAAAPLAPLVDDARRENDALEGLAGSGRFAALQGRAATAAAGAVTALYLDSLLTPARHFAATGTQHGYPLEALRGIVPTSSVTILAAQLAAPLRLPFDRAVSYAGILAHHAAVDPFAWTTLTAAAPVDLRRPFSALEEFDARLAARVPAFASTALVVRGIPQVPLVPTAALRAAGVVAGAPPPPPSLPTSLSTLTRLISGGRDGGFVIDLADNVSSRGDVAHLWHVAGGGRGPLALFFDTDLPQVLPPDFPRDIVLRAHTHAVGYRVSAATGKVEVAGAPYWANATVSAATSSMVGTGHGRAAGSDPRMAATAEVSQWLDPRVASAVPYSVPVGAHLAAAGAKATPAATDAGASGARGGSAAAAPTAPSSYVAWPPLAMNAFGWATDATSGDLPLRHDTADARALRSKEYTAHSAAMRKLDELETVPVALRVGAAARTDGFYQRLAARFGKIPKSIYARSHPGLEGDEWREVAEALACVADNFEDCGDSDDGSCLED